MKEDYQKGSDRGTMPGRLAAMLASLRKETARSPPPTPAPATPGGVEVANHRGVLASIAAAIAELGSNIENVQSREKDGRTTSLDFLITVHDRFHLARIIRRLRRVPHVMRILRMSH